MNAHPRLSFFHFSRAVVISEQRMSSSALNSSVTFFYLAMAFWTFEHFPIKLLTFSSSFFLS